MKINELEEKFKKRSIDFSMIQGELKTIKEFRKKKAHMEQELTTVLLHNPLQFCIFLVQTADSHEYTVGKRYLENGK